MARILIADDSAASRLALRNLLEGNDWEVCGEAEDGLAAVEKATISKAGPSDIGLLHAETQWPAGGAHDPYRRSSRPATALYVGQD